MKGAERLPAEAARIGRLTTWSPSANGAQEASDNRFRLIPFRDIVVNTSAAYLVRGVIPRIGLTVIYGAAKSGKSFWTMDLLLHVALGWEYRGKRVKQGAVVYCIMEGNTGFGARVEAFRLVKLPGAVSDDEIPFYLVSAPMALVADQPALTAAIRETLGPKTAVAAIAIDTVNRSLTGSESSDQDMSNYVRAADTLRDAFSCAVVLVHHSGLEGGRPRGHTSLPGSADAQISVVRNKADHIIARVELMKDGAAESEFVSAFQVVEVGIDEDGELITSLVVNPVDPADIPAQKRGERPARKLPPGAQIAVDALKLALAEVGESAPASNNIPSGTRVVKVKSWRNYAYQRGISSSDQARAKEKAFERATSELQARRLAMIWGDLAYLGGGD
jgi:hypothetical protein